jgi:hypothetical protein
MKVKMLVLLRLLRLKTIAKRSQGLLRAVSAVAILFSLAGCIKISSTEQRETPVQPSPPKKGVPSAASALPYRNPRLTGSY